MTLIKPRRSHMSDFFSDDWLNSKWLENDWTPAVNVVDEEEGYEIEVAAPGIKKEDFKVAVENGVLTITGESSTEDEEKSKNYTRKEFSSRSFTKSFTLPENISDDEVTAKYEDGVLKLSIKKSKSQLLPKKEVVIQ